MNDKRFDQNHGYRIMIANTMRTQQTSKIQFLWVDVDGMFS